MDCCSHLLYPGGTDPGASQHTLGEWAKGMAVDGTRAGSHWEALDPPRPEAAIAMGVSLCEPTDSRVQVCYFFFIFNIFYCLKYYM